ncbi:hypothetical protein CANINC_002184 [Pichia inconspicua]|uniref:Uncharacterized protein n=1 Tax=Pichia inconspicua TaxID=52247 RepID=A0A4T0X2D3_9ASCO|nr:hypothetical protein CANINC_002184 [[Candida] inconspicua]
MSTPDPAATPTIPTQTNPAPMDAAIVPEPDVTVQSVNTTESTILPPLPPPLNAPPKVESLEHLDYLKRIKGFHKKKFESKNTFKSILDAIPRFVKTAPAEAAKFKTRYNSNEGVHSYFEKLIKELEIFPIHSSISGIFIRILKSTPDTVMRPGIMPPQEGWHVDGVHLIPEEIVELEELLNPVLRVFLKATGWIDYTAVVPYLAKEATLPKDAAEFYDNLVAVEDYDRIPFDQLMFSIKIAWIRSKPDTESGVRLVNQYVLEGAIGSWSLLQHCKTSVKELTQNEAHRTYELYVAKAKGTLYNPRSVLYNWALDFQRYISASHPNLMHFVRACVNYLNKLLKNQSEIPSLDFLDPWFLVITSREALTHPRETNYASLEGGSPQPAFTASSNGKRKETNHGKPGNKRQQVTSVKPQGGAAKSLLLVLMSSNTSSSSVVQISCTPNLLSSKGKLEMFGVQRVAMIIVTRTSTFSLMERRMKMPSSMNLYQELLRLTKFFSKHQTFNNNVFMMQNHLLNEFLISQSTICSKLSAFSYHQQFM